MRIGACAEPLVERWGLAETVARLAAIGYDGIELTAWDVSDTRVDASPASVGAVTDAVDEFGVDVVGVYRYFRPGDDDYSVTHPDAEVRSRTVDYLRRVVDLCDRLGGSVIVFGNAEQRRVHEGTKRGRAWANAREAFGSERLLSALEAADVTLCIEPLTWKADLVTSAVEAAALADEVDHPNVRMVLDTLHLLREVESPGELPAVIRRLGPAIGHVHADDTSLRGAGGGGLDWGPIVGALRDVGYDGYLSVEMHDVYVEGESVDDREACLERSIECLRDALGQP